MHIIRNFHQRFTELLEHSTILDGIKVPEDWIVMHHNRCRKIVISSKLLDVLVEIRGIQQLRDYKPYETLQSWKCRITVDSACTLLELQIKTGSNQDVR